MSNRYATGMGLGLAFRNAKERKWFLEMFNQKVWQVINRAEKFPDKNIEDIIGDNLGIMGGTPRRRLATAIRLRDVRDTPRNTGADWVTQCYAEQAHMVGNSLTVVLFNTKWYVMEGNRNHSVTTDVVVNVLWARAHDGGDVQEGVKDALIKLLVETRLDEGLLLSIRRQLPRIDLAGLRTVADFELACE